jgi:hypothetical protein
MRGGHSRGGESAGSISVSRVRGTFDLERWANVILDTNVSAFDLMEGGAAPMQA